VAPSVEWVGTVACVTNRVTDAHATVSSIAKVRISCIRCSPKIQDNRKATKITNYHPRRDGTITDWRWKTQKLQNCTSGRESDDRFWVRNPHFLFALNSNHSSTSLSFRNSGVWHWQTDGHTDVADRYYTHSGEAGLRFDPALFGDWAYILRTRIRCFELNQASV